MVQIIHGEDSASSRKYLNELNLANFKRFDAISADLDDLRQVLKGKSLFSKSEDILIENLFSKKAKNFDEIVELINSSLANIVIYESKEVGQRNISLFPKSKADSFKLPQTLFSFLDGIYPGNGRALSLFNQALSGTELEILTFMIIRHIRLMLGVLTGSKIEEVQRLVSWQRDKLSRQARQFGLEKLKKAHHELFEMDYKSKSGGLSLPLKETIDIWLTNL